MTPAEVARLAIREKRHTGNTRGLAPGCVQCNLAVAPQVDAFDVLLYCRRNRRACPVLEPCDPGDPEPKRLAPKQAIVATQVSSRFPRSHGAPNRIGDPAAIGADPDAPAVRSAGRTGRLEDR